MTDKECVICGKPFKARCKHNIYCSEECRVGKNKKDMCGSGYDLPTATIGAINELKVSIKLLGMGYYVFRTISSNSPFDIYAYKDGSKELRVEIRAAVRGINNNTFYFGTHDRDRCNIYAAVNKDDIRFYDSNKNEIDLNDFNKK